MNVLNGSTERLLCCAMLIIGAAACEEGEEETKGTIQVRCLFDLTGPTAEATSDPLNAGLMDYIDDRNANGGIKGYKIKYQIADHAYDMIQSAEAYAKFKEEDDKDGDGKWDSVVTIFGEGTPDTLANTASVTADKMPYFSGAFPGSLAAPQPASHTIDLPDGTQKIVDVVGAPYNFFAGTDYSTGIRIGMKFASAQGASKIAFIGCSNPYCTGPLPAGKTYANQLGLEIAPDQCDPIACTDEDENTECICPELGGPLSEEAVIAGRMADYVTANSDIDWVWIGNLTNTTVLIVKGLHAADPNIKFIVNVYGFDESVFDRCGTACVDRMYGVMPFAAFGDTTASAMNNVVDLFGDNGGNLPDWDNVRYVQGHVTGMVWSKAIEKVVADEKKLTGENIKAALETFDKLSLGGLLAPISYSPTDHRPNDRARIYSINSTGQLVFEDEVHVDLQDTWLGW